MNTTESPRQSLAELAARVGESVPCAGNLPVALDDPDFFWYVDVGSVNLFIVEFDGLTEQAAPQHLLRREVGALIPGVSPDAPANGTKLSVVAKGGPGTLLKRIPAASLTDITPSELVAQLDEWVIDFTRQLARYAGPKPRPAEIAVVDQQSTFPPCVLTTRRGVSWVAPPAADAGSSLFLDLIDPTGEGLSEHGEEPLVPLTYAGWLTTFEETSLTVTSTETLIRQAVVAPALRDFHNIAFALERLNRQLAVVDEANLERAQTTSRRDAEKAARRRLFNIYDQPIQSETAEDGQRLIDALKIIGKRQGIEFAMPTRKSSANTTIGLADILDASGVRARRIKLDSEHKWWHSDSNSMLAFRRHDHQPVALVPGAFGSYRLIDPATKQTTRINAKLAAGLQDEAWLFYPPLSKGNVGSTELLRLAFQGCKYDLIRLVCIGFVRGLTLLLPALALGFIADYTSAGQSIATLHVLALALAGFGVVGALLHMYQNTSMMRLEARSVSRLEAAFWDRLLRLPSRVLQQHPSGDLAMSGMTFQNLRAGIHGVAADSLLSVLFLLPVFAVIFFYDTTLGLYALSFSMVSLVITLVIAIKQITPHGRVIAAIRRVVGRMFQIVVGIGKLRVQSAEGSAFEIWARDYREQKQAELELGRLEGHAKALADALPFLAAAVLLYAVYTTERQAFPLSDFLVVYTVFMTYQYAVGRLGESIGAIAGILPAFKQMQPILSANPESDSEGEPVDFLSGDILFDHVSFRYDIDGPLVLDDVTIQARPGEFIAIAGESGAGKSTLFRIALGLDRPSAGAVYYDDRDLRHLNLKQLRRQVGAVPQAVAMHPQDLWDNVVGHHTDPSIDEVWQAIRVAVIEGEIKTMAMGLLTMVGDSGSVLSGGESQRVAIARAVMGQPTIMLLDEATNWLDNENQATVMANLTSLTCTRIVIAHRLSTLVQADRIYVLKEGRVVQSGSFQELMGVDGDFKELVQRQVA
ncbi:MAG: ATP-binding cassette domain-containing protein [Gammaproteobacteria bacterium]|nr:ATP-binding cassette domain-containing protein [Gammaproteobacteria bacterium]